VVGHLEDVRAEGLPGGEQIGLLGQFGVARQQDRACRGGGAHHQGGVVHRRAVVRVDVARRMRRPQYVEGEAGPRQPASGGQRDQRHPGRCDIPGDTAQRPCGLVDRAYGDPADRAPAQGSDQAADVVGVQVAEQHERDPADPEPAEARIDRSVGRAGVDQHHPARSRSGQHDGIALPDVAGNDHPARGRPPWWDEPGRDDHDRGACKGREQHGARTPPPDDHGDATQRTDHEHRSRGARRPRQRGAGHGSGAIGHGDQPRRGPPRQPGAPSCHGGRDRRHQRGQHAKDRGRCDGRGCEQVGDDRHRADQPAQPGHDRRCHEEGRGGHRERLGSEARYAARLQRRRPPGRQQHERGRGRHRQPEPRIDRQRGIGEQQDEHRGGERRQRRPRPPHTERHQGDRSHHRRPDHAR